MQKVENHTFNAKLSDSKMYLFLLLGSFVFTNIGIILFTIPLSKSFSNYFPDVFAYLEGGYIDARVVYSNIMGIASSVAQAIGYLFFICLMFIICWNMFKVDFIDFKKEVGNNILIVIGFAILLYLVDTGVSIIYKMLGDDGTSANQLTIYAMLNSSACVMTIILVVFLAPIVEELLYRKFLIGCLTETCRLPLWLAGIVSSLIFALAHLTSGIDQLVYFPTYFLMGGCITLSYCITKKNIWVSIFVHMLNNLISVVLWALTFLH